MYFFSFMEKRDALDIRMIIDTVQFVSDNGISKIEKLQSGIYKLRIALTTFHKEAKFGYTSFVSQKIKYEIK